MDRRALAEGVLELLGIHRRDRCGVERADVLEAQRPGERLPDGYLLVDRESDEERERLLRAAGSPRPNR